ncbi:hypothetical protein [Roseiconus lacunae]|uniref:Uncharacterized protein n=1 Tax=Roseiconus lacunae TaxID=2605694 RepID=A0ABT7PR03_9BACT|nr:hypothetical protein [Roseiconus lacunae]MCD0460338.1 hypothetical protein [Roseiconus lacunae]MDM4018940.1 hypothetical protein [Roseiconus lacunae]WRQ51837.1 hypothetical protein U8335_04690 [Stieleria sp. HD01]
MSLTEELAVPTIVHLVPNSKPKGCGVTDYAIAVCEQTQRLDRSIKTQIVRVDGCPESTPSDAFAEKFWEKIDGKIKDDIRNVTAIVLHYSGYGYSQDGAPDWLATAIGDRPQPYSRIPVVTFFHELYATAWPWRRTFWHSRRQRLIAEQLATISDSILTNRQVSATWLEENTPESVEEVRYLPVPSNIGEPSGYVPYQSREPIAILFGRNIFKRPFTRGSGATLTTDICRHLGIERIIDIGNQADWNTKAFEAAGIEIQTPGYLSGEDVLNYMLQARIGFFSYYPDHLEKSGILAAFARCGVPMIAPRRVNSALAELIQVDHQLHFSRGLLGRDREQIDLALADTSERLHRWSLAHCVTKHAQLIINACIDARMQNGFTDLSRC